jgi:hypothetical protein
MELVQNREKYDIGFPPRESETKIIKLSWEKGKVMKITDKILVPMIGIDATMPGQSLSPKSTSRSWRGASAHYAETKGAEGTYPDMRQRKQLYPLQPFSPGPGELLLAQLLIVLIGENRIDSISIGPGIKLECIIGPSYKQRAVLKILSSRDLRL